jgi:hypothetical protein
LASGCLITQASFEAEQEENDVLGFLGKGSGLKQAEKNLRNEFGLSLDKVPDGKTVATNFERMAKEGQLSPEAQTALLYRLVIMNFLIACKIMRDKGQDTEATDLMWLTELSDRSVGWSEKAPDHVAFEQQSSPLNMNIVRFLESFGVHGRASR